MNTDFYNWLKEQKYMLEIRTSWRVININDIWCGWSWYEITNDDYR